jgi:hypothetical protein
MGFSNTNIRIFSIFCSLKIFYDHGDIIRLWCPSPGLYKILGSFIRFHFLDGSEREIGFLIKRLVSVTNGDEAKEV